MTRVLAILSLCFLAGCSEVANDGGGGIDGNAADSKYLRYGERFGNLLMKRDFTAAYERTSSHVQQDMTFDDFVAAYDEAVKEYSEPKKIETDINTADPELLGDEDLGFPPSVPTNQRRARVAVIFSTKIDEQGYALAGFTCWINVIEENGQDRICTMEYVPTD